MDPLPGPQIAGAQDELVLRSSKGRALLLLCAAVVFVVVGFLMGTSTTGLDQVIGWFGVIFFGLGAVLLLFQAVSNRSYLLLTRDGFQMSGIRKTRVIPWSDVTSFVAVKPLSRIGAQKLVMFDYRPGARSVESFPGWARGLRSLNRGLTEHDAALADTYGLRAEALAALMNDWRSRFA